MITNIICQGLQGSLADWCDCPWWHHGHLDQVGRDAF